MESELKTIRLDALEENNGQVDGVPANPRIIHNEDFETLKKSIQDNPEMLSLREIVCVPVGEKFVVICGNMRLRALRGLGYEEAVCKVVQNATPKQLRAYVIKDNISFGKNDLLELANFDENELREFGLNFKTEEYEQLDEIFEDQENPHEKNQSILKISCLVKDFEDIKKEVVELLKKYEQAFIKK